MDFSDFLPADTPIAQLIEEFHKLPGIGPKSAQRLAYYLIRMPPEDAKGLADAIIAAKDKIIFCSICQNITEGDPCSICVNRTRDQKIICVVEEPLDVLAIEKVHVFKGLYHVLHGVISPMNGIGPENIKIKELLTRLKLDTVEEIILATNPNLEGEATSMYIHRLLSNIGIRITKLARGLPIGSDLEYADDMTLSKALEGRQDF